MILKSKIKNGYDFYEKAKEWLSKNLLTYDEWIYKFIEDAECDGIKIFKNGWVVINGKLEPIGNDIWDVPSKEREQEIIDSISQDLENVINKEINKNFNQKYNDI
jgi:hypothetical protein